MTNEEMLQNKDINESYKKVLAEVLSQHEVKTESQLTFAKELVANYVCDLGRALISFEQSVRALRKL